MKNKLWLHALAHSVVLLLYITGVAWVMSHAERIFGKMQTFWGPVAFLLLFVFSALISGLLVLGRPAYLFFNGQKKESMKMLFYTIGWLFVITVAVFAINVIIK